MKLNVVVAGNMREFDYYCEENLKHVKSFTRYSSGVFVTNDARWMYLSSPNRLRGLRNYSVIYYGTWADRKDASEICDLIKYAELAGDVDSKGGSK